MFILTFIEFLKLSFVVSIRQKKTNPHVWAVLCLGALCITFIIVLSCYMQIFRVPFYEIIKLDQVVGIGCVMDLYTYCKGKHTPYSITSQEYNLKFGSRIIILRLYTNVWSVSISTLATPCLLNNYLCSFLQSGDLSHKVTPENIVMDWLAISSRKMENDLQFSSQLIKPRDSQSPHFL